MVISDEWSLNDASAVNSSYVQKQLPHMVVETLEVGQAHSWETIWNCKLNSGSPSSPEIVRVLCGFPMLGLQTGHPEEEARTRNGHLSRRLWMQLLLAGFVFSFIARTARVAGVPVLLRGMAWPVPGSPRSSTTHSNRLSSQFSLTKCSFQQ